MDTNRHQLNIEGKIYKEKRPRINCWVRANKGLVVFSFASCLVGLVTVCPRVLYQRGDIGYRVKGGRGRTLFYMCFLFFPSLLRFEGKEKQRKERTF